MLSTLYEMPYPNNGDRYDLSIDELGDLLNKAYNKGFSMARMIYGEPLYATTITNEVKK